jgi:hypothetical protein
MAHKNGLMKLIKDNNPSIKKLRLTIIPLPSLDMWNWRAV